MDDDDEIEFDLVGSHFGREFDLTNGVGEPLGEFYLTEFVEKHREIEEEVNEVKRTISELCSDAEGKRKWRINTQKTHLMGALSRRLGRRHSNAFCKFYQILARFPELMRTGKKERKRVTIFRSLHLCEVPGHFLSAIDHFLQLFFARLKWKWTANSLNPHYEYTKACDMFLDDELIVDHPKKWMFGRDNSGDVTRMGCALRESGKVFDLVTADGSTYSLDHPEDQESLVIEILLSEVECALECLREGGNLVVKVYSCFTASSTRLFVFLMAAFARVVICKPPSSKSGNTERYAVCLGYRRKVMDCLLHRTLKGHMRGDTVLRKSDCEKILACSRYFSRLQKQSMQNNIELFASPSMTAEETNILVDRTIERVMRECKMGFVRDSDLSSSIFFNLADRPWKDLFIANHVERLKELEDPIRAEQFLKQKQVQWSMANQGGGGQNGNGEEEEGGEEDDEQEKTEIEWTKDEMKSVKVSAHLLVPSETVRGKSLVHSLFIDPELWVALKAVRPTAVRDMFENGRMIPEDDFQRILREANRDNRGEIRIRVSSIHSRVQWIRLLLYLFDLMRADKLSDLTLLHDPPPAAPAAVSPPAPPLPPSTPPSVPLVLSRFSASVMAILSILFFRVKIVHPNRRSETIAEFSEPNDSRDVPGNLEISLETLKKMMVWGDMACLSFVPLAFLSEIHPLLLAYNNEMIKRVINDII